MKKLLAIILVCVIALVPLTLTGCSFLDDAIDTTLLIEENEELKSEKEDLIKENEELKSELATIKFELAFPDGLVTESCILNSVNIIRDDVNTEGSIYAVRADGADVQVTINGGSYNAGEGSLYNIAIWAHNGAHVIINDGTFTSGNDVNDEANHVVYAAGGSIIEINGGLFMSAGSAEWLVNCQDDNVTIIIKGGSFIDWNPADNISEGEHTNFVAEGYHVECEVINEGTEEEYRLYTVVEGEPEPAVPETPDEF